MNTFATLAVFVACLAVGSCGGYNAAPVAQPAYGRISNYGQAANANGAAASAAAVGAKPVEIIAGGPRYGQSEQLRPVLLDSGYNAGHNAGYAAGHNNHAHIVQIVDGAYNQRIAAPGNYAAPQRSYGRPRYSVQSAGATLLYPGVNNYRKYASPVEYSKVVLPVRAAPPVAKLYLPENNYASNAGYQVPAPKY